MTTRMPVAFLPHGGGPWPFVDMGWNLKDTPALKAYLESVRDLPKTPPKALLVISAHWEEGVPTVMTAEHPPMLYDYYGFPPESYQIQWPAPGAPALAKRVQELLGKAGFESATDAQRGFDHGTFVPLKLTYPDAKVPTIQLSLKAGLDPEEHLAIGRALAPLRDEGVLIVGSGFLTHNMRFAFRADTPSWATEFDAWAADVLARHDHDALLDFEARGPAAHIALPTTEHFVPVIVAAGAAPDRAETVRFPITGFWGQGGGAFTRRSVRFG